MRVDIEGDSGLLAGAGKKRAIIEKLDQQDADVVAPEERDETLSVRPRHLRVHIFPPTLTYLFDYPFPQSDWRPPSAYIGNGGASQSICFATVPANKNRIAGRDNAHVVPNVRLVRDMKGFVSYGEHLNPY